MLYISLFFSNLIKSKTSSSKHRKYNFYAKIIKILEICKQVSEYFVNELSNVPHHSPIPKFLTWKGGIIPEGVPRKH